MNNKELDCVILIPGNNFSIDFVRCFADTLKHLNRKNIKYEYYFFYHPIISSVRNNLLAAGVAEFDKQKINHSYKKLKDKKIVFIDSDMVWSVDSIDKLLNSDKDFVSGAYSHQDDKHVVVMKNDRSLLTKEEFLLHKDPFVVRSVGLGFFAAKVDSLEKLKYPFFDTYVVHPDKNDGRPMTEDEYFCSNISKNGYSVYVDPNIIVGHIKSRVLRIEKE
jgi:hypothetical protein